MLWAEKHMHGGSTNVYPRLALPPRCECQYVKSCASASYDKVPVRDMLSTHMSRVLVPVGHGFNSPVDHMLKSQTCPCFSFWAAIEQGCRPSEDFGAEAVAVDTSIKELKQIMT